jgi:hypothetical protein
LHRRTLDGNKNNTGMRPMDNLWPAKGARVRCRELAASGVQRLVASSLMIYLVVASAQRVWALLNSDVGELVRRMH